MEDTNDRDNKLICALQNFSIFDRKHMNKFVSLDFLEGLESIGHEIVVVGYAKAYFEYRAGKDEGQGDDEDEEEEFLFVELSEVFSYTLDYGKPDDPVYILTLPERFLAKFMDKVDPYGHTYILQDFYNVAPGVYNAVLHRDEHDALMKTALIQATLRDYTLSALKWPRVSIETPTCNQKSVNTTHVTPFIAFLACGLVNENLQVVSSRLPEPDKNLLHRDKVKRCRRVKELLDRARKPRKEVDWNREGKFMQGYLKKVWVEGEMYSIGDVILVLNRNHLFWEEPGKYREIPLDAMIQDFFWFGWITFLDRNAHTAHLQWFEHGSRILLSKRADDRQLFYMPYCESSVVFKTKCTLECFMFNQHTGAFYDIAPEELDITKTVPPPDNCPSCLWHNLACARRQRILHNKG
ncbi:hypothetical protein NMY22_g12265 [Coprinellus aureogranulatus]|nr:hypothetical protein NMY22_g12265 [Coprinellus aureogranulatus]